MRRWVSRSEEETRELGVALAAELAPDGVLLLSGDLGTGKTVLAQGVAAGLGVDPREVLSPSFTLIREHSAARGAGEGKGAVRLVHVDLYRLEPGETAALGLDEELAAPGVKVVEWAERLPAPPPGARRLSIRRTGRPDEREISETVESDTEGRKEASTG